MLRLQIIHTTHQERLSCFNSYQTIWLWFLYIHNVTYMFLLHSLYVYVCRHFQWECLANSFYVSNVWFRPIHHFFLLTRMLLSMKTWMNEWRPSIHNIRLSLNYKSTHTVLLCFCISLCTLWLVYAISEAREGSIIITSWYTVAAM